MPPTLLAPDLTTFTVAGSLPADPLAALCDALAASDATSGLEARLGALLVGAHGIGLGAGAIVGHEGMAAVTLARAAAPDAPPAAGVPTPVPAGAVWRRWLRLLERRQATYACGAIYALPLDDVWVRTEIGDPLCGGRGSLPNGLLVAPLTGGDGGRVLATLAVDVPGAWPPAPTVVRAVELLARYAARHIEHARLAAVADRRAERLQRLHEAGAALSRSLDELEIVRELARQVERLIPADGVIVAHPDLERGVVRTAHRRVRGLARPRADQSLGDGVLAAVARTGVSVLVAEYDPERDPRARADDVVGDGGPAGSVLAAPMRVGTRLVGVVAAHTAALRAYSEEDEELLQTVASQAGTAIANARLYAESEGERRQSRALAEVARAVSGSLRLGDVLRLVLRHTMALLRAEGAWVALRRDEFLHIVSGVGSVELLGGIHVPVASSVMGGTFDERRAIISNDARQDAAFYHLVRRYATIEKSVLVPLYAGDVPVGVVAAVNRGDDFTDADAHVLQRLGDHVGVAIANARLFEEVSAATGAWKVAFDAIASGLVVLDEQGRVGRCNLRAAELLGADGPKALLGTAFAAAIDATPVADESGPSVEALRAAAERGETARATLHSASRGRVYDMTAAPHPDGGAVVTFDDVTEQRHLAGQLVQREKLAAVGRLVGGVAHELNDPLATVLALAERLQDAAPSPGLAGALHAEARRAAGIAGRLLAFAGHGAAERAATDVNAVLLDALELRRYALRAHGVDIVLELDYELPTTWADSHQLRQLFVSLVTHAERALALAPGVRRLALRSWRDETLLVVAVTDSASAMPAAADLGADGDTDGAAGQCPDALALSIADGIVREHGGTLRVELTEGGGATFVVELPVVPSPEV